MIPSLTFEEARVFGALIEKSQATPEYYPLTLNALTAACNQKSSREPVVTLAEDVVEHALEHLKEKGLVSFVAGAGRVRKYMHRACENGLGLSRDEACALSIILLRGPQTAGEIKGRAGRQFEFASIEAAQDAIIRLTAAGRQYLEEAPRRAGQKEVRYRHRFFPSADEQDGDEPVIAVPSVRDDIDAMHARIAELQLRVEALEDALEQIRKDLY